MDPNTLLNELRDLAKAINSGDADEQDACLFAEKFEDLDGWIGRGGFLPADWSKS